MSCTGSTQHLLRAAACLTLCLMIGLSIAVKAETLGAVQVDGATLVSEHWGALYTLKTCVNCTDALGEPDDNPVIQSTLLRVYRANSETETITIRGILHADTEFRTQLGEQIFQRVNVLHPFRTALSAEDSGPPSKGLLASVQFEWEPGMCEVIVPVNITMGANTWGSTLLWENGITVTPTIQVSMVILPPEPQLTLNPSHEADRITGPLLIRRDSAGLNFTLRGCGISPMLKLGTVRLDGAELIETPYPDHAPFGAVAEPGHFTTQRLQPSGEPLREAGAVGIRSSDWVFNTAGCCRASTSATFAFPEEMPLGRHRLNVTFVPVKITPSPLGSSTVSPIEIEQEFIIFGPEITLSNDQLSPGDGVEIRGTGFPPNSRVKVFARVRPLGADEREIALGTAPTHLDGSFGETFQLPDEASDFWLDLALWKADSPLPHRGLIRVFIDDQDFHLDFDRLDSELAYCRTAVLPQENVYGDCPIRVGVIQEVSFVRPDAD